MSNLPVQAKRNGRASRQSQEDNSKKNKLKELQQARTFIVWYKHMVDNERQNLLLYLSENITLEWFGRTLRTKKKVTAFMKYNMQCSRHDFTSVESIEKIQSRCQNLERRRERYSESPLQSPELIKSERPGKRKLCRDNGHSPEWAEGCKPDDEIVIDTKRLKTEHVVYDKVDDNSNKLKRYSKDTEEISHCGDGGTLKKKCTPKTPPNKEIGQGDCLPSTSGADSEKSHETLNAQLPKLAVECNGYIEFTRSRNSNSTDAMKWERKCKVQISYSVDPLNEGEYIIWALRYTDESNCRRNLLSAFEEAAKMKG